jgi:hypothetical protein
MTLARYFQHPVRDTEIQLLQIDQRQRRVYDISGLLQSALLELGGISQGKVYN